jgi:bidirectional [NiFe] hydrogenase diaphorase subunit
MTWAGGPPREGGDARLARLEAVLRQQRHRGEGLIEVLHVAQQLWGHLPRAVLAHVARELRLPPSRVVGVATFYNLFTLAPRGEHTCTVCLGTACWVKASGEILAGLEREAGVAAGATSADGRVTLEVARCVGACGIGPVVVYDGEVAGRQEPGAALRRVRGWRGR